MAGDCAQEINLLERACPDLMMVETCEVRVVPRHALRSRAGVRAMILGMNQRRLFPEGSFTGKYIHGA